MTWKCKICHRKYPNRVKYCPKCNQKKEIELEGRFDFDLNRK